MAPREFVYFWYAKKAQLNPGGSSLNTCRILRALGEKEIIFCGSVGDDENGGKLLKLIEESGVDVCLQRLRGASTAVCLCLIEGPNRCLVADIGAAFKIQLSWLADEAIKRITPSKILYIEGYFVPERFPICEWLVETMGATAKVAVNLNAKYIVENLREEFKFLVQACDLIFGNISEFSTLARTSGCENLTSWVDFIARSAAKDKIFVITDGEAPVRLIEIINGVVESQEIPVEKVENIKDTTGAGDAFVAGFFSAYIRGKTAKECVQEGIHVAGRTLTQIGCHLPEEQ